MVKGNFTGTVAKLNRMKDVVSFQDALVIKEYMDNNGLKEFHASTEIMIIPGYDLRCVIN